MSIDPERDGVPPRAGRAAAERELWSRVDAVLDERGDPLEDPGVLRALGDSAAPLEPLAELERLTARLDAVRALAPPAAVPPGLVAGLAATAGGRAPRSARRLLRRAALAASLLAAGVLAVLALRDAPGAPARGAGAPPAPDPSRARVLRWRVELTVTGPDGTVRRVQEGGAAGRSALAARSAPDRPRAPLEGGAAAVRRSSVSTTLLASTTTQP